MGKRDGRQKGPQDHAEGAHGKKTRAAIVDQLRSGEHETSRRGERMENHDPGERRLVEQREQHDEAEKNSERTRLERQIRRDDPEAKDDGSLNGPNR